MLCITQIESGSGATNYYVSVEKSDNYYLAERGEWGGKGAQRLGLHGEIKRSDFLSLSLNKIPGTQRNLTVRTKAKRTSGYDFCFDVPKSLSIYLAETGDQNAERLILDSFKETMNDIEERMQTRVCKGQDRTTGNITYASFVHRVSRPVDGVPDPQYHVHSFVFNTTFDEVENRWKAGQFMRLVQHAPVFQKSFHDRLMAKLTSHGYKVRATKHAFELSTVSRELIEKFSRRSQEIIKAVGHATGKVRSWFAHRSRKPKSSIKLNDQEQLTHWRSRMTSYERDQVHAARHQGLPSARTLFSFGAHHRYYVPDQQQERAIQR